MLCNLCLYLVTFMNMWVSADARSNSWVMQKSEPFLIFEDVILSSPLIQLSTYLLTYIAFNRDDGGHRQVSFAFLSLHHHTLLMLQFFWPYYGLYLLNHFVYTIVLLHLSLITDRLLGKKYSLVQKMSW